MARIAPDCSRPFFSLVARHPKQPALAPFAPILTALFPSQFKNTETTIFYCQTAISVFVFIVPSRGCGTPATAP